MWCWFSVQGVLIFESVDEILKGGHSNESYWAVLSCGVGYYAVQGVLAFESVDEILKCDHSNKSYWAVLSCDAVYYAVQGVLTFESVDEILKCDHSNESYWTVRSCSVGYYAVQGGSNFWVCGWNPKGWPFKWKLLNSTFLWCWLLCCTRWFYIFRLWGWNSNWPFKWTLPNSHLCGAVCFSWWIWETTRITLST